MDKTIARLLVLLVILVVGACSQQTGGPLAVPSAMSPGSTRERASHHIGRNVVAIQEFSIASGDTGPRAITVSPKGKVWFLSANGLNRMSRSGSSVQTFSERGLERYNDDTDVQSGDGAIFFTAACSVTYQTNSCGFESEVALVRSTFRGHFDVLDAVGDDEHAHFPTGLTFGAANTIWAFGGNRAPLGSAGGAYTRQDASNGGGFLYREMPGPPSPAREDAGCPGDTRYSGSGIARGSDGAIYIVAQSPCASYGVGAVAVSVVLRVDAAGNVTNIFLAPDGRRIVNGPDGNLWITQGGATNAIARMTTAGTITEFALSTADAQPLGIARGNDGAIWFTEEKASRIGRITTSGAISEYPTPTANAEPWGIASLAGECATGHGRIWFTEAAANKIGRLQF